MTFTPGLFRRICDRTGFAVKSTDTVKQWNGLVVRRQSAEPRHPQEFVKGKADKQTVPLPRPRQTDQFVGPLITYMTEAASAGALTIDVESSVRFAGGDIVGIIMSNGDIVRIELEGVPTGTSLLLRTRLPHSVDDGAQVTNYSAVSDSGVD